MSGITIGRGEFIDFESMFYLLIRHEKTYFQQGVLRATSVEMVYNQKNRKLI